MKKKYAILAILLLLISITTFSQSIRKSYTEMTAPERTAYINALLSLRATNPNPPYTPLTYPNSTTMPFVTNDDVVEFFATIHADPDQDGSLGNFTVAVHPTNAPDVNSPIHGVEDFLPWHRQFIREFEKQLKREDVGNPWLSLAYWDWRYFGRFGAGSSDPSSQLLWDNSQGFLGVFGTGGSNNWSLGRTLSGTLPSVSNVNTTQAITSFSTYRDALEMGNSSNGFANIHGWPHGFVGGAMGNVLISPRDPIFYFHHAMIDYLWQRWEEDPSKASSFSNNTMPTFNGTVTGFANTTVNSIVDSRQLGIFYADHQTQTASLTNYTTQSAGGKEEFFYYQYKINLQSSFIAANNTKASVMSCTEIHMLPGFEARNGSRFKASINSQCSSFFPDASDNSGGRLIAATDNGNKEPTVYYQAGEATYDGVYRRVQSETKGYIRAYPVPTRDKVTVEYMADEGERVFIELYDVSGKEVLSFNYISVPSGGNHVKEVDMSSLKKGVYFMVVKSESMVRRIKVLKE